MPFFRIKNWQDLYENNRTRELKTMQWIPFPNKLNGNGYATIMEDEKGNRRKDGPAIFGAFVAIVELASACSPRGDLLKSDGTPHTFDSIGRLCRISPNQIESSILFCSQILKWIEIINLDIDCGNSDKGCGITATPPSILSSSMSCSSLQPFDNAKHGKRSKIFVPPTLEDVKKYCEDNNFGHIAEKAFKYYSEAEWHDKDGNQVKNWKQKLQGVWFDDRKNPIPKNGSENNPYKKGYEA